MGEEEVESMSPLCSDKSKQMMELATMFNDIPGLDESRDGAGEEGDA